MILVSLIVGNIKLGKKNSNYIDLIFHNDIPTEGTFWMYDVLK